jgi:hypothetical protein
MHESRANVIWQLLYQNSRWNELTKAAHFPKWPIRDTTRKTHLHHKIRNLRWRNYSSETKYYQRTNVRVWGFHSDEVEDFVLPAYDTSSLGDRFHTFRRKSIPLKDALLFFKASETEHPVQCRQVPADQNPNSKTQTFISTNSCWRNPSVPTESPRFLLM